MMKKMIACLIACVFWGGVETLAVHAESADMQRLNDALGKLGYSYDFQEINDREMMLRGLEEVCESMISTDVGNVKFTYYMDQFKEDGEITDEEFEKAIQIIVDTEKYIQHFNPEEYMAIGANFADERFHISKWNKTAEELLESRYYDYDLLDNLFSKYENVDRKRALSGLFYKTVGDESDSTKRHKLIMKMLGKGIFHNPYIRPVDETGQSVRDPLVLLDLHEMWCGDINRIGCDLFASVGYDTRMVQLSGHQVSELYYDGTWHYFDADTVMNVDGIVNIDDKIPSVGELAENPYYLDLKDFYFETKFQSETTSVSGASYPSFAYAFKGEDEPFCTYKKIATDEEMMLDTHYGWKFFKQMNQTKPEKVRTFAFPAIPTWEHVEIKGGGEVLLTCFSDDADSDLLGYRIFVSDTSRGWEYPKKFCTESINSYVWNSYMPQQYDLVTQMPPADVLVAESENGEFSLDLPQGIYYISAMPYDQHGEDIGKVWYMPSNEIKIEIE